MSEEQRGMPFATKGGAPSSRRLPSAAWRALLLMVMPVALINCGGDETRAVRASDDPEEPAPNASAGDGLVHPTATFTFGYCGICPRDPNMDWGSDFSNGFLGEGESCTYAPSRLVDGDPQTGWAEGVQGVGIGAEVAVPAFSDTVYYDVPEDGGDWRSVKAGPLDLSKPVRIWAGYGQSPELFSANARPKRVRVTVLRLRLMRDPEPLDATGCDFDTYVEPVAVAEHEVALRDLNGFQPLPVPGFEVEHYDEYPLEWLSMDGGERYNHQQRVDAGEAAPYQPEPREFAYLLKLTVLDVYPGTRY